MKRIEEKIKQIEKKDDITNKTRKVWILKNKSIQNEIIDKYYPIFLHKSDNIAGEIGLSNEDVIELKAVAMSLLINGIGTYGKTHDPDNPKDILRHIHQQLLPIRYEATKLKNGDITLPQNIIRYTNKYKKAVEKANSTDPQEVYKQINWTIGDIHPDLKSYDIGAMKVPYKDFQLFEISLAVKAKKEKQIKKVKDRFQEIKEIVSKKQSNSKTDNQKLINSKKKLNSALESEIKKEQKIIQERIDKKKSLFKKEIPQIIQNDIKKLEEQKSNPTNPKIKQIIENLKDIDKQLQRGGGITNIYDKVNDFLDTKESEFLNKIEDQYKLEKKRRGANSVFKELDSYINKRKKSIDDGTYTKDGEFIPSFTIHDTDSIISDPDYMEVNITHANRLNYLINEIVPEQKDVMKLFFGTSEKSPDLGFEEKVNYGEPLNKVSEIINQLSDDYFTRKDDKPKTSYLLDRVDAKQWFKNPNYQAEKKKYEEKKEAIKNKGINLKEWKKSNPEPLKTFHKTSKEGQKLYKKERDEVYKKTVKEAKRKGKPLSEKTKAAKVLSDIRTAKKKIYKNIHLFIDNPFFYEQNEILKKSFKVVFRK